MMAKRRLILIAVLALVVAGIAALLFWTSRPPQFASLVTGTLGRSLGLEITVGGASQYRLRGAPVLVVRDVVVREATGLEVRFIEDYSVDAGWVEAVVDAIRQWRARQGAGEHLLFSYHGLPQRLARAARYSLSGRW